MRFSRGDLVILLGLVAAVLIPLGRVVGHGFFSIDDDLFVSNNRTVQEGLTLRGLAWAFTEMPTFHWHPLTWISLMLDREVYGPQPWGYHLTNLLLHMCNVLLLFWVLRRMTGARWRSALVAALFAVAPVNVEAVAWISERKGLLSAFFGMITLLAYARYAERPGWGRYLLVVTAFGLCLMAKSNLVTLPFALLLLDYWPLGRFQPVTATEPRKGLSFPGQPVSLARLLAEKVFPLVMALAACLATYRGQGLAVESQHLTGSTGSTDPWHVRAANSLVFCVEYLGKLIYPVDLAVYYPYPEQPPSPGLVLGAALFLAAVSGLALVLARRRPYLAVGWLWYLATLLPVAGLVPIFGGQGMADRYLYVPAIGLYLLTVWAVADLAARGGHQKAAAVLAGALLVLATVYSSLQASYWRDSIIMLEHTLAVTKRNAAVHYCLGAELDGKGRKHEAATQYREALQIKGDHEFAHHNLGVILQEQGDLQGAEDHFRSALKTNPRYAQAHFSLGLNLAKRGELKQAKKEYEAVLEIDPSHIPARLNLGILLYERREFDKAEKHFRKVLKNDPENSLAPSFLQKILDQPRP